MKVVMVYEKVSGQCVNLEKSLLLFGKSVPGMYRKKTNVLWILKMKAEWDPMWEFQRR